MARIAPDTNDGYVWLLNETDGYYKNTGSVLPNNSATNLTISGTVIRTGTGVFNGYCPFIPGTGNFPTGSSSTRNYLYGANNINPSPPFTISCWVNLRSLVSANITHLIGKLFRDHTVTNTFATPYWAVEMSLTTGNNGGDLYHAVTNDIAAQTSRTITDFQLPIQQWAHIGLTHDGSAIRSYLNGCQLMTYSGATQLLSTASTSVTYQDNPGYIITASTGTYDPGITDIGNHGDEVMTAVALPFNFTIYRQTFSSVNASSNGFIEFGQATQSYNFTLPNASLGITVCVFQKDENTAPSPTFGIFTSTTGTTPNRIFNIEWRNQPYGGGGTLNYEIRLFEGSSIFEIIYAASTSGSTGCIGMQSAAGAQSTVYNNSIAIPAAGTRLVFSPSGNLPPGAWVIGATPIYLVTSSATKEEANYSIQDVRIANVARPLSYFKNVYAVGALPLNLSPLVQYYKLRAYDTSCITPTAVTWIDTQISLTNAPAFPCSGPYTSPEVLYSWMQ